MAHKKGLKLSWWYLTTGIEDDRKQRVNEEISKGKKGVNTQ
jgi:hypothetical protein